MSLCLVLFLFMHTKSEIIETIDGDNDVNGPEPEIPHTTIDEPALVSLGNAGGCYCREVPNKMSVFYGNTCKKFPKSIKVKTSILKFRNTVVEEIAQDDFQMLDNLTYIEIESNLRLYKFEPGCFRNMNNLTNMSISFNERLSYFEENLFYGLYNLKEIYLRNNGFRNILDATKALSPKFVPKLLTLVLNRNVLKQMKQNDFLPMEGTSLEVLNLVLCQIDFIHPDTLRPLQKLKALRLGENLFSVKTITKLLRHTLSNGISLQILNLYEAGFRVFPPKTLLDIIAHSNITYLNLGRNHFEYLSDDAFPYMPNLETLVLRDIVAVDLSEKVFQGMTKLKHLLLNGNRLTHVHSGLMIKTLILLDISSNSYYSDTHFDIPNNIFTNMSNLQKLDLSYNQIEGINTLTFRGLGNLTILKLNNAHLSYIEAGTFLALRNLQLLNLENNFLGSDMTITSDLFKGLENLQELLLGGCHITNITSKEPLFIHLSNLRSLGLQRNGLHAISNNQFPPLYHLKSIDLSENNISPWENQLFGGLTLKYINISQNKLFVLTKKMFFDFQYLEKITVDGNPFSCDCAWYPTLVLFKNNSCIHKPFSTTNVTFITCVSPGKWHRHSVAEYLLYLNGTNECIYVEHSSNFFLISFFTIFTALSLLLVIICYYYRWNIRYWIFLAQKEFVRRRKQRKVKIPQIKDYVYSYDAFVSYSNEDKYFVDQLVDILENSEPHLKLCVYERDFQIGTIISDSVMQHIAMSRRIILVISDSFAKSQWCRWEMHLAECHQINDENGLLLILLEKVTSKNMTPFLKYIMRSRIYLEWDSDERRANNFWNKLKCTLFSPKYYT